jgi:hypothetical protein
LPRWQANNGKRQAEGWQIKLCLNPVTLIKTNDDLYAHAKPGDSSALYLKKVR